MNEIITEDAGTVTAERQLLEHDLVQRTPSYDEILEHNEEAIDRLNGAKEVLTQFTCIAKTTADITVDQEGSRGTKADAQGRLDTDRLGQFFRDRNDQMTSLFPPDTTPEEDEKRLNDVLDELGLNDKKSAGLDSSVSISSETPRDTLSAPEVDWANGNVALEAPEASALQDLPIIQVKPGELAKALWAAERVLAEAGDYYTRSDRIVCIRFDQLTNKHHVREMSGQDLMVAFAGLSKWSRFDKRKGEWTAIDPCPRVCKLLAESWRFSRLKALNRTVTQPYLRPDATVSSEPGYDPETGILGIFKGGDLDFNLHPNRDDAEHAISILDDLLSECAFAAPEDRSAALSALLTAAVRPSLPIAPMFHVMAHQPGSGKSYLCQLITALATSTPGSPVAFPRSNDACDKLLLSQLMKAPAVIEFDNLTDNLRPFDKLCSALTSESLEGRQLGHSRTLVVPTRTLFLSSGNNVRPIEDMVRRCISIHLDPGMEAPAARIYKRPNLLDEVRRDRIKFIGAALTIVRAWVLAGQPSTHCPSLAGYTEWSNWCRQPLLWLGQPDPATSVFKGLKEDPSHLLLGRVLAGWHDKHGSAPKMIRDVVKAAVHLDETDDFRDALAEAAGGNESINVRKLGHWLARNEGRIVGPYRLRKAPKTRNAENWQVVESDVSVSSVLPSSKTT